MYGREERSKKEKQEGRSRKGEAGREVGTHICCSRGPDNDTVKTVVFERPSA
jgi:hypothetical protein